MVPPPSVKAVPSFLKKTANGGVVKAKSVPAVIRKKRVNYRLRKLIAPKSPMVILNEMIGTTKFRFETGPLMMNDMAHFNVPMRLITAFCEVEGECFQGTGPNRQIARNICAENVIQFLVTRRSSEAQALDTSSSADPLPDDVVRPHQLTTETPWAQLASLALFKLFNDWQAHGIPIPQELMREPNDPIQAPGSAEPKVEKANDPADPAQPPTAKSGGWKIPPNPTERHPVQLLNEIRGPMAFEVKVEGETPPDIVFVMSCSVDGKTFQGQAKNKKEAKKKCALQVLEELHQVVYPSL